MKLPHSSKLNRATGHRMAMLRNMVSSLVEHDRIKTTLAKAKEARKLADKMVTLSKKGDVQAKLQARSFLREHFKTIPKLFGEMADRYRERNGGYTRIHRIGNRVSDNAPMAVLEYVDAPGDLKYEMLIKQLARRELDPSLKVSTTFNGEGVSPLRKKREFKKWLGRIKAQRKFEKQVEKMKICKEMTPKDLDSAILQEIRNLRIADERKEDMKIKYKLRKKGGHLSYENMR
ncbi:ribosomal protein L17 [Gigaspora margarita]|uniref:Ribosomal protein L17 n=1 Tax=Gigaspora margarita TaxID=4874 RepID=A0A8H4A237_GIGMA|nr:ribosomal protein L17 [Gigaspora margarita]